MLTTITERGCDPPVLLEGPPTVSVLGGASSHSDTSPYEAPGDPLASERPPHPAPGSGRGQAPTTRRVDEHGSTNSEIEQVVGEDQATALQPSSASPISIPIKDKPDEGECSPNGRRTEEKGKMKLHQSASNGYVFHDPLFALC